MIKKLKKEVTNLKTKLVSAEIPQLRQSLQVQLEKSQSELDQTMDHLSQLETTDCLSCSMTINRSIEHARRIKQKCAPKLTNKHLCT